MFRIEIHTMTIDTFVDIHGNLKVAYDELRRGTMRHVDQLMTERRTNKRLRGLSFYTADGFIYFVDGETVKLAITREQNNIFLSHLDYVIVQNPLDDFCPHRDLVRKALDARTTEVFDLSKLELDYRDRENSFLYIPTTGYDDLNPEQRRFAERLFGKDNDFVLNMKMLKKARIDWERVEVTNPRHVQKVDTDFWYREERHKYGPLAQASWLSPMDSYSGFFANFRSIKHTSNVRGVRL